MPSRGGYVAFFEQSNSAVVELATELNEESNTAGSMQLHACLESLASAVRDVVGTPHNYAGLVPVPVPANKSAAEVRHPVLCDDLALMHTHFTNFCGTCVQFAILCRRLMNLLNPY